MLTIITATLNCKENISRLFDTLNGQFDSNKFEWIIADGGSNDGTYELVQSFSKEWIKVFQFHDFGIYDAINKSIKVSTFDYYLVVGSDDSVNIEALYNAISETDINIDLILGKVEVGNSDITKSPIISNDLHRCRMSFHSVGTIFSKRCHLLEGFYSSKYPLCADEYFFQRLLRNSNISIRMSDQVFGSYSNEGLSAKQRVTVLFELFLIKTTFRRYSLLDIMMLGYRLWKFRHV